MDSPEIITPTPEEAVDWPLHYVNATEVKAGDYLIVMGEFHKVHSVRTYEPYAAVQIRTGNVVRSSNNVQMHWVLQKS